MREVGPHIRDDEDEAPIAKSCAPDCDTSDIRLTDHIESPADTIDVTVCRLTEAHDEETFTSHFALPTCHSFLSLPVSQFPLPA